MGQAVLGGPDTCSEGFVLCSLLGQHGSCSTAQQPGELSENSKQNLRNKWQPHPVNLCCKSRPIWIIFGELILKPTKALNVVKNFAETLPNWSWKFWQVVCAVASQRQLLSSSFFFVFLFFCIPNRSIKKRPWRRSWV